MSNELAPWDQQQSIEAYGKYAADKDTVAERATPILHVVQNNSPEFSELKSAQPGEIVLRLGAKDNPDNPNLGKKFQGVVVARGVEYIWWGDRDAGEGILARMKPGDDVPQGRDPKDLLWPKDGGNERPDGKKGPIADLTRSFIVCAYKDGQITDPMLVTYSRGGAKTGQQLNMLLNRFKGPSYAAVLSFETEQVKSSDGKPFYILKAKPAGIIQPDQTALLDKLKTHHDSMAPMFAVDDGNATE